MKIEDWKELYDLNDIGIYYSDSYCITLNAYDEHGPGYDEILNINNSNKIDLIEFVKNYATDVYTFEWYGDYEVRNNWDQWGDLDCHISWYSTIDVEDNGFGVLFYDADNRVGISISENDASLSEDDIAFHNITLNAHDVVGHGLDADSYTLYYMKCNYYGCIDIRDVITLSDEVGNAVRFRSTEGDLDHSYVNSHDGLHLGHYETDGNISVDLFDF